MAYSRYSEYQQSNHKWIGKIPNHWGSTPLKRKYRLVNGSTPKSSEPMFWNGNIVWITPSDFDVIINGYICTSSRMITYDGLRSCGTTIMPEKSIVVTSRAPIGKIAQAGSKLCTNQGCKSLVRDNNDLLERFVFYTLLASDVQLNALGLGTTFMELSKDDLGYYPVALPPPTEQEKIIVFLDWKTVQIDELIAKKQLLIEKLKEKRIALITHAVTKGLNPGAHMRDSGIHWLGDVPKHWEVKRLRFSISSNPVKSEVAHLNNDLLVSFVPMEAVGVQGGIDLSREKPIIDVYNGYTYFGDGDIIIAKITPCFENGKGAIAETLLNGIAFGTTELHVMRRLENMSRRWLFYLSISDPFRKIGASEMLGAGGQKRVPEDFIKDFQTGIPSLSEQREISDFLDLKNEQIDKLIIKNKQLIEKLTEYRIALITFATTGKIDLRKVKIGGVA